jgi:hypothetical protein
MTEMYRRPHAAPCIEAAFAEVRERHERSAMHPEP